jgi:prepilin-type processing-associated H-X9-DG protein/prepilin-type N-terminal cleavage/methylation domain-containing protein
VRRQEVDMVNRMIMVVSSRSPKAAGFTLVELLVVIGIIAVLISMLLPALNKARDSAQTLACESNVKQLVTAAMMFAGDHHGYLPTVSDDFWAKQNDPSRTNWDYRADPSSGLPYVKDWASSLTPYLGGKNTDIYSFQANPSTQSKLFVCPSDIWQNQGITSGYMIINNVTSPAGDPSGYFPISYGINADICSLIDFNNQCGRFGPPNVDAVGVIGGINTPSYPAGVGLPLNAKLSKVEGSAQVLMFADCGTRPNSSSGPGLNFNDALYYTSNYCGGKTLFSTQQASWLGGRIPLLRHKGRINVAYCDGHAETVLTGFFNQVRVSPYR